jgi:rRNA-processing protein FCF1
MKSSEPSRLDQIYPNVLDTLKIETKSLTDIIEDCLFVVDTNTLLTLYKTKTESLAEIKRLYERLVSKNRFFVPEHVLREFFQQRGRYHSEIYNEFHKAISQNFLNTNVAALENDYDYESLKKCEAEIQKLFQERRVLLERLKVKTSSWYNNDPVWNVYKELFSVSQIIHHTFNPDGLKRELERRNTLKIPPGFEDNGKSLNADGDLQIWLSILAHGKAKDAHIVFVSSETKKDWWTANDDHLLYPRFELIHEYYKETSGKTFLMLSLSKLMSMMKTSSNIVNDVKASEVLVAQMLLSSTRREHSSWESYYFYVDIRPRIQQPNAFEIETSFRNHLGRLMGFTEHEITLLEVEVDIIPQVYNSTQPPLVLMVQISNKVLVNGTQIETALQSGLQELYAPRDIQLQNVPFSAATLERYSYGKAMHYRSIGLDGS